MREILMHPGFLAFYGWLLYNLVLFNIHKDQKDKTGAKLGFKKYLRINWDNWLLTLAFVLPTALFAPNITKFLANQFGQTVDFYQWFYLGTGVLSEITIAFIKWVLQKFRK